MYIQMQNSARSREKIMFNRFPRGEKPNFPQMCPMENLNPL